MTDALVDALDEGHRRLRELLVAIGELPRDSVHIDGAQMRQRQILLRRLRREFVALATLKERSLWPAVRRHLVSGDDLVARAIRQKRYVELLMDKLRWFAHRDPRVDDLLARLLTCAREHLDFENALFERLSTELPDEERQRIAEQLRHPPALLPTRPHPDLPTAPWAARLLGPVAAAVDRVHDRLQTAPNGL